MASLTEVYEGGRGATLRRLYVGVGLFVVGAALTVAGITVGASAGVASWLGLNVFEARELAGVLGGFGPPLTFLGIVIVLPQAGRTVRTAAVAGTAVALAGVVTFASAYPTQWYGDAVDYTLPIVAVYALGAMATFWCLFTAVANFKTRNDPGGTVKLEISRGGRTRVVEVSNDRLRSHLGGIGLLGGTPDGEAETQTARSGGAQSSGRTRSPRTETSTGRSNRSSTRSRTRSGVTVSDGGSAGTELRTPGSDAELVDGPSPRPKQDVYCGNCAHFRYVRTEQGMRPYCNHHGEVMDDMESCSQWSPNN